MPSYDMHQHLWPEQVVSALSTRREPPRLRGRTLELADGSYEVDLGAHDLDRRLALLDRDGIDVAIVSLQPTLGAEQAPELVEAYHEGVLELAAASRGRLLPLACGVCLEGFVGACVPAVAMIGDLEPLPGELERARQILFVHPGVPARGPDPAPLWWAPVVDYTAQMQAAYAAWLARGAAEYPGLPVVFAILAGGAPFQLERLRSWGFEGGAFLDRNVFLETASYGRHALELCLAASGVNQVLYGSDVPVIDSRPTLRALTELGEAVHNAVWKENPSRLFGH